MTSNYFEGGEDIDIWHKKRRSRFTASVNYRLIGTPAAFDTYVEEKAIEASTNMWERPELEFVASLLWGKVYEEPAAKRYMETTKNYTMTYIGREQPIFYPDKQLPDESGGSPDMANILSDGNIDYLTEIKCPRNPSYHFKRLLWRDQFDIKQNYLQCYTQMQNLIRITGAFGCDFISYDERQLSKKNQIKIIEVKPDQKFLDNLEIKLINAVRDKYKLLSKYMGTEIKNKTDYINFLNQ
ncbi:MAG: YqaJ viral recombinase family protein [Ferruginibacter sp.]